jgi:hypothetical protein
MLFEIILLVGGFYWFLLAAFWLFARIILLK